MRPDRLAAPFLILALALANPALLPVLEGR